MSSFFRKVQATVCPGDMDRKCENHVNQQQLAAHKRRCDLCGSTLRAISRPDPLKIGLVLFAGALLLGGGALAARGSLSAAISRIVAGSPSPGAPVPDKPREERPAPVTTSIQIESDSGSRVTLGDLERVDKSTFRSRQSYRAGDKFRLHVDGKMTYLYIFFRSGAYAKQYAAGIGTVATLPSSSDWFQLDNTSGIEEFVVVTSTAAVASLEQLGESAPDPERLERVVRSMESGADIQLTRLLLPHQ